MFIPQASEVVQIRRDGLQLPQLIDHEVSVDDE